MSLSRRSRLALLITEVYCILMSHGSLTERVRADLRQLLDGCPIADDVILCVSELAANAAVHSRSGLPGGTFTVCVKISPGHYTWIAVEDNGGPWNPPASDPLRPHGLEIVRALASEWGIDGDHNRRTIWAEFDWPGDS